MTLEKSVEKLEATLLEVLNWNGAMWQWAHGYCYVCEIGKSYAPDAPRWEQYHAYGDNCSLGHLGVPTEINRLLKEITIADSYGDV